MTEILVLPHLIFLFLDNLKGKTVFYCPRQCRKGKEPVNLLYMKDPTAELIYIPS